MIKLRNGFEFKYCCASGALGFDGRGYWWERPFISPNLVAFITKTLTFVARQGNYRWWKFWKTFRINSQYTINSFGLPNPGYRYWINNIFPKIKHKSIIVSICPFTTYEAYTITHALSLLDIKAIEVNISCPNTVEKFDPFEIIEAVLETSKHPVIVKVSAAHNYLKMCEIFGDRIVIDAINTVPWNLVHVEPSPLFPLEGGLSDEYTGEVARLALEDIKNNYPNIQVISGNGIFNYKEAKLRFDLGADAISFGTVYILTPWRPTQIIKQLNARKS